METGASLHTLAHPSVAGRSSQLICDPRCLRRSPARLERDVCCTYIFAATTACERSWPLPSATRSHREVRLLGTPNTGVSCHSGCLLAKGYQAGELESTHILDFGPYGSGDDHVSTASMVRGVETFAQRRSRRKILTAPGVAANVEHGC